MTSDNSDKLDILLNENKKKYDYIFGHGSWDVYSFANQIIESEKPVKGYPVLKYSEWEDSVNKFIVFGHIHVRQHHKKLY